MKFRGSETKRRGGGEVGVQVRVPRFHSLEMPFHVKFFAGRGTGVRGSDDPGLGPGKEEGEGEKRGSMQFEAEGWGEVPRF